MDGLGDDLLDHSTPLCPSSSVARQGAQSRPMDDKKGTRQKAGKASEKTVMS